MNILVFTPFYPPHTGGVENYVEELSRELSGIGHFVVILAPNIPKRKKSEERIENIRILRFPAFELIENFPVPKFWSPRFWKCLSTASKKSPDAVVSQTRFFITSLVAILYARFKKIPHIHVEHGSDFVNLSNPFTTKLAKLYDLSVGKFILRHSNENICISKAVQRFVEKFDNRPSTLIYRGMDFSAIDEVAPRIELRKRFEGKLLCATVARLSKWKGVDNTLLAIQSLPAEVSEKIVFFIVGDGEDADILKRGVRKSDPVVFFGNIPRKDVFGLLKASDIYIHSARPGGGLATSLIEGLYSGCAVIATPHEGADEIVRNGVNGILLKESSPGEIRDALLRIVRSDQDREKFRRAARSGIRETFSWKAAVQKYLRVIRKSKQI